MCLDEIYPKKRIIKEGMGYKTFRNTKEGLIPCFYFRGDRKTLGEGKWLKEKEFRVQGESREFIESRYPCGFHLFKRLKDAKYFNRFSGFTIKKVKFRKGCARGLNNWAHKDLETIVAKEIFIPKSGNKEV